jgi:N-acetylglucosamine kinase-like BadF-type ATPase
MKFVIGIDGGGTKTSCLFNSLENFLPSETAEKNIITGKGTNIQAIGSEEMKKRLFHLLEHGLNQFSLRPEDAAAVCCGFAGAGRPEDRRLAEEIVREVSLQLKFPENLIIYVESDLFMALHGALPPPEKTGMLVIAGTGSNAVARNSAGEVFRSGGWGHIIGDEGSGYHIGLCALNYIAKAYDGRAEPTILTGLIMQKKKWTDLKEVIPFVYRQNSDKKDIADFAPVVMEAAEMGDKAALSILEEAAEELLLLVKSLSVRSTEFNKTTSIFVTGSVITHSPVIRASFEKGLQEKKLGVLNTSAASPVYGASLLARQLYKENKKTGDE